MSPAIKLALLIEIAFHALFWTWIVLLLLKE